MCCCDMFALFFFFKQKTAYEMRISDWSSDVCSSDLLRQEMSRIVKELRLSIFDLRSEVDRFGGLGAALSEYLRTIGTTSGFTVHQIGRASCRERVCQYV